MEKREEREDLNIERDGEERGEGRFKHRERWRRERKEERNIVMDRRERRK
jgi:hypothetical protein